MKDESKQKPLELSSIPDPLASNKEKLLDSYGLKYATSIQQEWFGGGMIDKHSTFNGRHQWIKEMRMFHRGEQSIQTYKDIAARQKEDLDWLNMDWSIINVVEKFDNIVINGISDEYYRLDIRSADRFSLLQKEKNLMKHKVNMASKDMLEKAFALQGVDLRPKGFVPEDEEQMNLYAQIKERPLQEISEQILIKFVKNVSHWDYIKGETNKDAVIADLQVARVYTDPNNGVIVEYVDPETYGHSYVERKDFRDAYYHFTVDDITINDIRRESGYDDTTCREIAKKYASANNSTVNDFSTVGLKEILDFKVHVMRFTFKSDKEVVYKKYLDKKNNLRKVAKRDSDYQVPEGAESSRLSKRMDTWYEGSYIVGSNSYIYNYKECENLAKDDMDRVLPPFIVQSVNIYKNNLKSFLSTIIPLANQMQYVHLKIQHLIAELKPDLIVLDLDQLAELNTDTKGESKGDNWKTALSILNTKGVVIQKRVNMGEDGIKDGPGARPMANQQGSALAALLNVWAHYYNLIRETTGINPARDGSLPADALVGINQMMQLASNTATKHIVDASVAFDKRICETISARLKGIFSLRKDAAHLIKMYEQAVGKDHIEALGSLKDRHIHEFGFTVEMVPAKEELDELRRDLQVALQEGSIDISEKSEIMVIAKSDIKQANEYMKFLRTRKIKERLKETEYNQKLQSQSNAEAAQTKIQGDMQLYGSKKQQDLQFEAKMAELRILEKQQNILLDTPKEDKEFQQNVYLEQIKNMQTMEMKQYDNDKKAERERENSTRQSKMIEQRQKDLSSVDFDDTKFDINKLFN
jgi:hypothetical protein